MKRHRDLNQSLEKFFLRPVGLAPHVFPHFMRVVEIPRVEKLDAAPVSLEMHA